jgi:hypothetical protein
MFRPIGLQSFDLEDREKLVLAQLEKGVPLALIQLLELEDILIKGNRLRHIVHLDRNVIDPVNVNAHVTT